jgi:O-antigen ligase
VLFGFLLTALFVPDWSGAATTPRWALAAIVLPVLMRTARVEFTAAHLFGLLFVAYAALSAMWSPNQWESIDALIKLIVLAEAFIVGSQMNDIRPIVAGAALGLGVSSAVILLGIPVAQTSDYPAGLFVNSNALGEIAAVALVGAFVHRIWWAFPLVLPALVAAHCRGAFLALAGAFIVWLWPRSKLAAAALAVAGIAVAAWMGTSDSAQQRLEMWGAVLHQLTLAGKGIGSFYTLYPLYSPFDTLLQRPEHLHNDWLEFTLELGIVGTVLYAAFLWSARSIVLVVLGIEALFGFPLHLAATAVLGGILSGHSARHRLSVRDCLAYGRGFLFFRDGDGRPGRSGYVSAFCGGFLSR